jgi:heat-inducible transcriptional repressor
MSENAQILSDMNDRSREVFRRVVEGYLGSGEPVGSRTLTRSMSERVSAATIRNVMQDLEYLGLLQAPHVSAGRVPTERGLRMFVDSLLEASLGEADRARIDSTLQTQAAQPDRLFDRVGNALSAITHSASLVLTPKREAPIRHIEFVALASDRALAVMVYADGQVENRVFVPPAGQTASAMREAANLLNAMAEGLTISELRSVVSGQVARRRQEIDALAADLIERGLAVWDAPGGMQERLIVRGRANLLGAGTSADDLERIRELFDDLERKRDIAEFLELAEGGEGVRIFIGSENKLFSLSSSSLVMASCRDAESRVIGIVGVIGPTRLNYGRIVPIVDYTAQLVGRMMSEPRH